jgi:hypothetical protein
MYVCTKFGQNPLKDVDSRVFTRMLLLNLGNERERERERERQ